LIQEDDAADDDYRSAACHSYGRESFFAIRHSHKRDEVQYSPEISVFFFISQSIAVTDAEKTENVHERRSDLRKDY
jgi:hypothetical protein